MYFSTVFTLTLIPAAFAFPTGPPVKRQGDLNLHPFHLPKVVDLTDRAFVGIDNEGPGNAAEERGEQSVSVADVKDASTLTSLIMFNPSSTLESSDDSTSSATASSISLSTLSEGQSAAFNPTASTTLSLLNANPTALVGSSSASESKTVSASIQTSGKFTPYSNADVIATTSASGTGVMAAAASEGTSITSGAGRRRPSREFKGMVSVAVGAVLVSALAMI
ncbi:hypothetical protein IAU59_006189 [Kwoniella sp. CBS 9459]